jgi:hypothetical protein
MIWWQPESYHRSPKRQYRRTAKRQIHETLSRIQTRQACLRRLRRQLLPEPGEDSPDPDRQEPYFIGRSQNKPVYLEKFLVAHWEDPVARVSAVPLIFETHRPLLTCRRNSLTS